MPKLCVMCSSHYLDCYLLVDNVLSLIGLKTVISELAPTSTTLAASICKKITGRLTSAVTKVSEYDKCF